jgi:hypothetical protein
MRTQRTLLPAVVVGSLAAVALAAAPAQAQQSSTRDAVRDVTVFRDNGITTRPTIKNGDIRRTTIAHKDRKVTLRVSVRDLAKKGDGLLQYTEIRTPTNRYDLSVYAGPGNWAGTHPSSCAGATHKINYRKDVFTYAIPRSCLGSPRWVRVGFATATFEGDNQRVDDARRKGIDDNGIALTPRLARG